MPAPLKNKTPSLKTTCDTCGKSGKASFLTGWIFKPNQCQCAPAENAISDDANTTTSTLTVADEESIDLPDLGERYDVLCRIGIGGMGSVYKVRDKTIDAILAVKVLQQELVQDHAALKRFEQEAESAKKLNHPNLVSVFEHGTTDTGSPFIVMDYLDGRSLADLLKETRTLESPRALRIFKDICEALSYAHKQGVIHRDIKPTNVIITNLGQSTERAHIVDFGIAKVMPTADRETHDLTQTGEIFGSPHYMSPEQCLGFMLDNRSDLYSLGCLMYESLTGAPPFEGANPIQVVVKHINEEPPEFQKAIKVDAQIDKLESVVFRCLDKEKTDRYQSADETLKDLTAIAAGKTVAKYAKTGKVKPMFSKRQALGFLVVFTGLTIYGTITAMMINNDIGGRVLGLLLSLVCLAGVYVFYSTALDVFRKRMKVLTERSSWQIILLLFLGTACLTALQYPGMILVGHASLPTGEFWKQLAFFNGFVHVFALVGSLVSGICFLTFRGPGKLNVFALCGKFALVACILLAFCRFGIPAQTSKMASMLGSACAYLQPTVARNLVGLAVSLDENTENLVRLSDLNHTTGLHEEELKNIERILQREPDQPWRISNAGETYKTHNQFDKALRAFNEAVAVARKESAHREQLAQALNARATYLQERHDFIGARNDLKEALNLFPRSEENMRLLAQVDCIIGNFQEAAPLLEKVISMSRTDSFKENVLLGIIYDNLGEQELSLNQFRQATPEEAPGGLEIPVEYAFRQLGLDWKGGAATKDNQNSLLATLGVPNAPLTTKW